MDFLQDVFANRKKLLKTVTIVNMSIPRYPEFYISTLMDKYTFDKQVALYLPGNAFSNVLDVDKQWFMGVVCTLK